MIKKILCAVDFSPASDRAVTYAAKLAARYNAKLKLLHVVSSLVSPAYGFPVSAVSVMASMAEGSRRQLDKLPIKLNLPSSNVETEVQVGDVSTRIEEAIQAYKPDLLAMGTHGRRGFERWIIGSITERLLRRSPVPVLVLAASSKRRAPHVRLQRILVTTDFSDGTANALDLAFTIARQNQAQVTLLHVLEEARAITSKPYRERLAKAAQLKLSMLVPADVQDCCVVDTRVEAGTPYHVILRTLQKEKIDLLVMNIHGISMLDRVLLGTTAERVLRAAASPMILVPPMKRTPRLARPGKARKA